MVISGASLHADDQKLLKAQEWLGGDKSAQLEILSQPYAKAPNSFKNKEEEITYQIGEALFRTPTLLGGQAAKARISCNSCHLSGAGNTQFQFPNISGPPGTADVSNSFFSSFRGNQNFDPIAIPDLRQVGKIPRDDSAQLSRFIQGLIVEEFNGTQPTAKTLDAITFYVQRVKYSHISPYAKMTVRDPISIINQSVDNIAHSIENDNTEIAVLLVDAARHQLGLIYERYNDPVLRASIVNISNNLGKIKSDWDHPIDAKAQSVAPVNAALPDWKSDFAELSASLIEKENNSLYNEDKLRKALNL